MTFARTVVFLTLLSLSKTLSVGRPLDPLPALPPPGVSFQQLSILHDTVVVARVSEVGAEKSSDLGGAGNSGPVNLRRYQLAVTKVIQTTAAGSPRPTATAGASLERPIHEATVWARDQWTRQGQPVPCLEKHKTYVFFLRQRPARDGYYLSAREAFAATDATIQAVTDAGNVDKWAWSRASGGLQMALLITAEPERPATGMMPRQPSPPPGLQVPCSLAIRNVSQQPVALNLYGPDHVLSAAITGGGGREFQPQLYPELAHPASGASTPAPFSPACTTVVAPGRIVFIGPSTRPQLQWFLPMTGEIGAWTIHLNYTSKRDYPDAQKRRLWKGTLAITKPVNIRMKRYGPDEPLPSRTPPARPDRRF